MSHDSQDAPQHIRWDDIPVEPMSTSIGRQFLYSETLMLARVLLAKGAHVPMHQHPNEQFAYVLSGALEFHIEDRIVVVRAGEVLTIPPNVPHEAFALEDTVDLDIFNPPRQDWIAGNDAYLRSDGPTSEPEPALQIDPLPWT